MPDKKLTDNEIIKALECCAKDIEPCVDCPATDKGEIQCFDIVKQNALDLINRLQASKEHYQKMCARNQENVMYLSKQCDELQAENERLKKFALIRNFDEWQATIKAKSYKEFAERLKSRAIQTSFDPIYGAIMNVSVDDIDNLLKELIGE